MLRISMVCKSMCLNNPDNFARCSFSITKIRSAHFKSFSEIFLSLFGLNPAERILKRLSFLKICSAVLLRFLFRPQTTSIFGRSIIVFINFYQVASAAAVTQIYQLQKHTTSIICKTIEGIKKQPFAGAAFKVFVFSFQILINITNYQQACQVAPSNTISL